MVLASSPSRINDLAVSRSGGSASVQWTPAVESDVSEYIVAWGPATEPMRRTMRTAGASASIDGLAAGDIVMVKAVNGSGLESWDWARQEVR